MSIIFFILKKYLKINKFFNFSSLSLIFSIISISLSVSSLIIIVAITNGFECDLKSRILNKSSHIIITKKNKTMMKPKDYNYIIDLISKIPDISQISKFISQKAVININKNITAIEIKGIEGYEHLISKTIEGVFSSKKKRTKIPIILLKNNTLKDLSIKNGEIIEVIFPKGLKTPLGSFSLINKFEVIKSFNSNYDSIFPIGYISIKKAQQLLKLNNLITGIEIQLNNSKNINKITKQICLNLDKSISIKNWNQLNPSLFYALKLEKTAMLVILFLIILLSTLGITSSLSILILKKRHEIAILKIMGITNIEIKKIFTINGLLLGIIGISMGLICGLSFLIFLKKYPIIKLPNEIYYTSTLPINLKIIDIVIIISSVLIMSFIASLIPAKQASLTNIKQIFSLN